MANTVRMSGELVGQVLGDRYKIEQKIGSGGFAIVYRAKDTRIGKYVAVKVLDREKVRSVRDIGRFRNEAATTISSRSPITARKRAASIS
jgi:serine/threonine-protein kinase